MLFACLSGLVIGFLVALAGVKLLKIISFKLSNKSNKLSSEKNKE